LIFAFRPCLNPRLFSGLSGKQKNKAESLRAPRLCGESEIYNAPFGVAIGYLAHEL